MEAREEGAFWGSGGCLSPLPLSHGPGLECGGMALNRASLAFSWDNGTGERWRGGSDVPGLLQGPGHAQRCRHTADTARCYREAQYAPTPQHTP